MIGRDSTLKVYEADELFHSPSNDSPAWLETLWFPFFIEDRGLSVAIRLWFSANIGKQGGTISAWSGDGEIQFAERWIEDFQGEPDLSDLRFDNGLQLKCTEALQSFQLKFSSDRLDFQLRFTGMMPPNPVSPTESPGMFLGHFEQPGHVQGLLTLDSNAFNVDCYSVRDRSWGPREMRDGLRLGNAYGAHAGAAFFTYIRPEERCERITGGYYLLNGEAAVLTGGERTTQWKDDRPDAIQIDAVDALGRKLQLKGRCVNVMASDAGNGVYGVLNLTCWTDASGCQFWGENHDIWSKNDWLATGRAAL